MKFRYLSILSGLMLMLFATTSCSEIDNYKEADNSIYGGVYDLATKGGKEVLIPGQTPNGASLNIYEGRVINPKKYWIKQDGGFSHTRLFSAEYRIIPEGPFIVLPDDTARVKLPMKDSLKFYVEPYLRIQLKSSKLVTEKDAHGHDINFIEAKCVVTKSAKWNQKLTKIMLLESTTLNASATSRESDFTLNVGDEAEVLGKELTLRIAEKYHKDANAAESGFNYNFDSKKTMYVRVAAITGGTSFYNYSTFLKVEK